MPRIQRRPVDGILLLDKPAGLSSNAALQKVRYLLRAKKGGHTGSLDPLATGMLPICFGEATKVSGFLLDADKHYRVTCRLGVRTDSADADGAVVETAPVPALDAGRVNEVLARFHGDIQQVPPMYSALKYQGRRLYELARAGESVERAARTVTLHALVLDGMTADSLTLDVRCSKGTYVRTLVEDVAAALGTLAHVVALRRLGVGPYEGQAMVTLAELEARRAQAGNDALDALLLPV